MIYAGKKIGVSNIGIRLLILILSASFISEAHAKVKRTLPSATTLRQLDKDGETLVLIDELEETEFKLPKGTKITYREGNLRDRSPYEDDENPGEIIDLSKGLWQQGILIEHLPGYSDAVKEKLNKEKVFISDGYLDSLFGDSEGLSMSGHKCFKTLVDKVRKDNTISSRVKSNFPTVLNKALRYYSKYSDSIPDKKRIMFTDYSVSSDNKRFFLVQLEECEYRADFVSHGKGLNGSGGTQLMLKRCANGTRSKYRTNRTRHGIFLTVGWHDAQSKTSKKWPRIYGNKGGVKLKSLNGFNKDVLSKGVVMHEQHYIKNAPVPQGRTYGCVGFPKGRLKSIATKIKKGNMLYIHAPQCGGFGE